MKILVVDDEPAISKALSIGLRARGYEIVSARTAGEGFEKALLEEPDVVILDLGLPDEDGVETCKHLRRMTDIPVVILSAHGGDERKVEALDAGADDFVTKPFSMVELEARLRLAMRHRPAHVDKGAAELQATRGKRLPPVSRIGQLEVDWARGRVSVGGQPIALTRTEMTLLEVLLSEPGRVMTHRCILERVWGNGYEDESHYVRVYVSRLRTKLGEDFASHISTFPGVGYCLELDKQ
jgi:two-component system KDP operon response regulator KdpE